MGPLGESGTSAPGNNHRATGVKKGISNLGFRNSRFQASGIFLRRSTMIVLDLETKYEPEVRMMTEFSSE